MTKLLKEYNLELEGLNFVVRIIQEENDFVLTYFIDLPEYGIGTKALLSNVKEELLAESNISTEKLLDPKFMKELKQKFSENCFEKLGKEAPGLSNDSKRSLTSLLIQDMLGLGKLEFILADGNLEEIVINNAKEPVWVYHKEFGWLKSSVLIETEIQIQNYANIIARRVGKQITVLDPLLDAHLITGDRANATLFPISGKGNTITIRRFKREPWTVTDFIKNKTTTSEVMALIWLAFQYELNIILSGGTASGKTSFMNVCLPFIQPNQRVITIEDTRELSLPSFLHWVPMTTRNANPEGQGEVKMIDLLTNSLRMRPDRIIVGEIRRQREAEVLFEAMHTGHSAYTTLHATTAEETIQRLTNQPISISPILLEAVHLNVVMFRNRRLGVRRVLQVAEFIPEKTGASYSVKANSIYRWKPGVDAIEKQSDSIRLFDEFSLHTGLTRDEIKEELVKKEKILNWMVEKNIRKIEDVGQVMARYYLDENEIVGLANNHKEANFLKKEEELNE